MPWPGDWNSPLVRPAGDGRRRCPGSLLPALGRALDRRRDHSSSRLIGLGHALDLILTGRPVSRPGGPFHGAGQPGRSRGKSVRKRKNWLSKSAFSPGLHERRPDVGLPPVGPFPRRSPAQGVRERFPWWNSEGRSGAARFAGGAGRGGKFE